MTRYLFGFVCVLALGLMSCSETSGTDRHCGGPSVCDELGAFECIDEPCCTPFLYSGFRDCIALSEEECAKLSGTPAPQDRQTFCGRWGSDIHSSSSDTYGFSGETTLCRQDSDCPPGDECLGPTPVLGECQMACPFECGDGAGECPEGQTCVWGDCGDHSVITGWDWDGITSVCE
jgi:hypothetical protein